MEFKSSFFVPPSPGVDRVGVCMTFLKEMVANGQSKSTDKIPCWSFMRRFLAAIGIPAMA